MSAHLPLVRDSSAEPDRKPTPGGIDSRAGWVVVIALTSILMFTNAARFLFGVMLKPVSDQFGWDRAHLSAVVLVGMIVLSVFQPIVGLLIDRVGPKRIVIAGVTLLGLALLPMARADKLWQFYFFWGVLTSIGLAAASPVNATAFVSRWFDEKRGTAMSVSTSGAAFGQLLIVPVAAFILTKTDWHTTYLIIGLFILVVMIPIGLIFLKDGPAGSQAAAKTAGTTGSTLKDALRHPAFWLMAFGFIACGWTMAFPQTHWIAHADDMGMSHFQASWVISVTAAFSIAGSLLFGMAADRHRRTTILAIVYALRALSFLLLLVLPIGNLVFVYAIILGISWSATTPLTAAIAADRYGRLHYGLIFGTMFTFKNLGFGVGSFVDGLIYDATGSYNTSLIVNVVMGLIAAGGILLVDRTPEQRPFASAAIPAAGAAD
ncbi:MAG: MFS transporter [Thermomicrobiales bacterium]